MPAPVITLSEASHIYGNTLTLFTADQASRWSANSGVLLVSVSPRTVYDGVTLRATIFLEPANQTRGVTVTATNASSQATATTIQIYGAFPILNWGYKPKVSVPAVISLAEDKVTAKVRYKGGDVWGFEFTLTNRALVDWAAFEAFRGFHRIHLPWYFTDPESGISYKLRFDQLDYETDRKDCDQNDFNCLARQYSGAV